MSHIFGNKSLKMALPVSILNKENETVFGIAEQARKGLDEQTHHPCCPQAGSTTGQLQKFIKTQGSHLKSGLC